jgi:hypothetical protein
LTRVEVARFIGGKKKTIRRLLGDDEMQRFCGLRFWTGDTVPEVREGNYMQRHRNSSMEPYELDFVTGFYNRQLVPKDGPQKEWKLSVPRAFLIDRGGENGVANRGSENPNSFRADMHAIILPDNSGLSPAVLEVQNKPIKRFVAINVFNSPADPHITGFDACVTDDQYKKVAEARGAKNEHDKKCLPEANRCDIYSHLDGWDVQMTVSRDIYSNSENVCRVVKAFLNKHTIRRDDLR